MRLGVLDVGSNTVHLLVVDAHTGSHPDPVRSHKTELRLAELIGPDGSLGERGRELLTKAVAEAAAAAQEEQVDDLVAFATSAVREATDGAAVIAAVREATGVDLVVLSGEDEAALTFLAVRRWFGWSSGRLLCLDIGGGSLEIACGRDELPDLAVSVPLGAGRLTRERLPGDPPSRKDVVALREHVWQVLAEVVPDVHAQGPPDRVVATSKTFRSLARLDGAAPYALGPRVPRSLSRRGLESVVERVMSMPSAERAQLPGVSASRAPQLLAGAVVAVEALTAFGVERADICPWAMREGVVLRRLDWLRGD
ncbi:MAG: exopolyphosphatase / guanosine-5-triphosphate,3-diphosphate pyrophosphatase [Frankiales bacterium]|nr:exopolyphosphatase / guanosine-5-triphosphate,3-diphosphate pyrophosphatase [Frankiales bacterium]